MDEISVNKLKTLSVPDGAAKINITHEWGDVVADSVSVEDSYSFTPDSIGVYKVEWKDDDSLLIQKTFYSSILTIITVDDFIELHTDISVSDEDFSRLERIVRQTVEKYTGQKFGPYINKTLEIQGDGGQSLNLPVRCISLTSIENNFGTDLTDIVEISSNSDQLLTKNSAFRGGYPDVKRDIAWDMNELFSDKYNFSINGNFGWEYVPSGVSDAVDILLYDSLNGTDIAQMRKLGVRDMKMGDFQVSLLWDQYGSTGSATADMLLGDFIQLGIGLI